RGRGLADAASIAVEVGFLDPARFVDRQVDVDEVAAQRIVVLVSMRRRGRMPPMVGLLVMLQDTLLVEFVFVGGHGNVKKTEWRRLTSCILHNAARAASRRRVNRRRRRVRSATTAVAQAFPRTDGTASCGTPRLATGRCEAR